MTSPELAAIRADLDALEGPGVAKVPASLRERCEERAAKMFSDAVRASGLSQRAVARRLSVDESYVRDVMSGARSVHLWMCLALTRSGQIEFARDFVDGVPDDDEAPVATAG